jgi:hypothetical protein
MKNSNNMSCSKYVFVDCSVRAAGRRVVPDTHEATNAKSPRERA